MLLCSRYHSKEKWMTLEWLISNFCLSFNCHFSQSGNYLPPPPLASHASLHYAFTSLLFQQELSLDLDKWFIYKYNKMSVACVG